MRWLALATDYDGTLASDGVVAPDLVEALQRLRASGRRLILITGRRLQQLQRVFPEHGVFDRIVAENGALLYQPGPGQERVLGEPAPELAEQLRRAGMPVFCGHVIIAGPAQHQELARQTIRDLGLDWQPILNKGSLMLLPAGISKASGLATALAELRLEAGAVVGVGDGENDLDLILGCGLGVAVADAVPLLRRRSQRVTRGSSGAGVLELIEAMLEDDPERLPREP